MMVAVLDEVRDRRRLFPSVDGMFDRIVQRWKDSGVPVDEEGGMHAALAATRTVGVVQPSLESVVSSAVSFDGTGDDDERSGGGDPGEDD
jgi:hypothetical protein